VWENDAPIGLFLKNLKKFWIFWAKLNQRTLFWSLVTIPVFRFVGIPHCSVMVLRTDLGRTHKRL
jgi:hypothetical protein